MKLTWRIILKDIVRERWGLLTWALFFVGQDLIGVSARNSTGIDADWVVGLQMASAALVFLQVTMGYVLVARLVQADPLIGTGMFWRTRPISASRLLAAKLLGALLLFALLPVLLLLPWWLYCQFGWHEIFWTAVEMAGWQLLMIAPAFLVASLTDDLGRVLLWTLLLVIGLLSWTILLNASLEASLRGAAGRAGPAIMFTRVWVCSMTLIVGSLAIAAHQFLTRRFARSVGLVVFALGLIALVGQVWFANWAPVFAARHQPALAPADPGLVNQLAFTVEPARGHFGGGFKEKNADKKDALLDLRLRVSGLPEDLGIFPEDSLSHLWSWGDGLTLKRVRGYFWSNTHPGVAVLRRAYALPVWEEDPETLRWQKVRRDKEEAARAARGQRTFAGWNTPPVGLKAGDAWLNGSLNVPNSFLAKMKAEPAAYRAEGHWMLYRPEIVAELPLKDGARAAGQAQTFRFGRLEKGKPLMVSTRASITHYGVWFSAAALSEFRFWFPRELVASVNRVTGDIVMVQDSRWGSRTLQVGGVMVTWNVLQVAPRMLIRDNKDVVADPQWLDHTFLVLLADKDVAGFDRVMETAKFELEPDPADQARGSTAP